MNFIKTGPCLYDHPVGYIPTCPKNHTDNIIPIVYGLVATKIEWGTKNKKDEKVRYAGCMVTDCDPNFIARSMTSISNKTRCLHWFGVIGADETTSACTQPVLAIGLTVYLKPCVSI
ncbi:MAG: hypothetical protein IPI54_14640 [Chitinophagaceae bacterium]|nr:hypothetical protein [Chitinophagaceae bacterium]